jgi:CRISPR/Cas system-associated exonuclease Cas4 (RecB family)
MNSSIPVTTVAKYTIAVTTIAKYAVCPSQVYLDIVLNDRIYENTKSLALGSFYHQFRQYFNERNHKHNNLDEQMRLCRKSLLEAYRFADINNFSYELSNYTLEIENRLAEEITKHIKYPVIFSEESISSKKYGLKGRVDAIVEYNGHKVPWDYKTGHNPIFFDYNKIQIICYCLLLQDNGHDATFGIIDYVDIGVQEKVKANYNNRKLVYNILANISNMIINKQIPELFKCNYYKHNGSCIHCSKLSGGK